MINYSLREIRGGLESGSLSSTEIVEAYLDRIQQTQPVVNAYTEVFDQEAIELAKLRDRQRKRGEIVGPLHGVPISIKENYQMEGMPVTQGLDSLKDKTYDRDADIVKMFKDMGAIILGRTNVPQAMVAMDGSNPLFGKSQNPWSQDHVTGGSSSGEACAVAASASLLGVGSDLGGSLRFPAAFCGVTGYKPTQNAIPNYGFHGANRGQNLIPAQAGFISKSSKDIAEVMELIRIEQGQMNSMETFPYREKEIPRKKLRIGVLEDDGFISPSEGNRRVFLETVEFLKKSGHEIVDYKHQSTHEFLEIYLKALSADGLATLKEFVADSEIDESMKQIWIFSKFPDWFKIALAHILGWLGEKRVAFAMKNTTQCSVKEYWALERRKREYVKREMELWQQQDLDFVLTPAAPCPAVLRGLETEMSLIFSYYGRYNLLGFPAGVVPAGFVEKDECFYAPKSGKPDRIDKRLNHSLSTSEGLPLGVHLVGRPWTDGKLLALMAEIEEHFQRKNLGWDQPRFLNSKVGAMKPKTSAPEVSAAL